VFSKRKTKTHSQSLEKERVQEEGGGECHRSMKARRSLKEKERENERKNEAKKEEPDLLQV